MPPSLPTNAMPLQTDFRSALRRLASRGRLNAYQASVSPHLEIAAIMKRLDGDKALLFTDVEGHEIPVLGNFLASRENCEAAFDASFHEIRQMIARAIAAPMPPETVIDAPAQEIRHEGTIDLGKSLPVLHHAEGDGGRFLSAGIVITRDPSTQIVNASYHRMQLIGPDRLAIKLDFGRHLRLAFERAQASGADLPVAIVLGADIALHYTAATMGSQMPEHADELAVAGGLAGHPLPVVGALSQDLPVPATAEIVIEGVIRHRETALEGPFGEFVGFASPADQAPVVSVTAFSHRKKPIYHAINGYGRETVMLRKYVLEASLLKVLEPAVPIVTDVEMTAGGLHRFHAVIQVRKTSPQHDGLQRNAVAAAFGALKDLDHIIVVDDDIDLRNPLDVEYALATRMEASRDLILIPGARGHEYVRAGDNGIRTKMAIDATVPFSERERFRRVAFADHAPDPEALSDSLTVLQPYLED